MKRLAIILGLAFVGCSKKPPQQAFLPPPVPIRTAEVIVRDVPLYFEAMGTIAAFQKADVKSYVSGLITGIHFKEGELVKAGDLLYTIDEAPYKIKVQEVEAQLSQNLATLINAQKKLDRYKTLSKQDLIAKVEWDELEANISLCEALVKADEARLASAKLDLEHCCILAPISGRTSRTFLHAGNMIVSNAALLTLSQETSFYVDFAVTEKELQQLPSENPKFELFAAGEEDCLASGEVNFLDHNIDPKSGMLSARGLLTTMHRPLRAGQSVRVHLFFGKKDRAKLVPLKAIKTNQTGPYVFSVKEDNTVELLMVKLGPEEKGMIVVEEGLGAATKIVTEGQLRLFPGSKVEEAR